jgi:hypothetical protein
MQMGDDQQSLLPSVALWLGIIGFFVGVISLALWFPWYWPTLSVKTSSETVAPSAGMPLSFAIEDTGAMKAHSVRYRCYFAHLHSPRPQEVTFNDVDTGEAPVADVLLPNDPVEVSCIRVGAPAVEADVVILVSFRPSFDWRRSSGCGRYILDKNTAGQLAWFRKSSAPCKELAKCLNKREANLIKYRDAMRQYMRNWRAGVTNQPHPVGPEETSCIPKE